MNGAEIFKSLESLFIMFLSRFLVKRRTFVEVVLQKLVSRLIKTGFKTRSAAL